MMLSYIRINSIITSHGYITQLRVLVCASQLISLIGGIVNGFFQNPVVSYIGTVEVLLILILQAVHNIGETAVDAGEGSTSTETPKKEIEVPNPKKEIIDNASEKPIPDSETSEQEKSVPEQTVVEQEPKDNTEMNNEPVQSTEGVSESVN